MIDREKGGRGAGGNDWQEQGSDPIEPGALIYSGIYAHILTNHDIIKTNLENARTDQNTNTNVEI